MKSLVSDDGLARSNGSEAGNHALAIYNQVVREQAAAKIEWVKLLRENGVKAAHPDDGWVNREKYWVILCYPQFDDGVRVGDEICLGWPDREWNPIVTVTRIEKSGFDTVYYYFKGYPNQPEEQS